MFRKLKRVIGKWLLMDDENRIKSCPTPDRKVSRHSPRGAYATKQRLHNLNSLLETLSPVARDLMEGYLETIEHREDLSKSTQLTIQRETELARVLTEIYHINLEEFRSLMQLEENL